jgi:hypothetical protein
MVKITEAIASRDNDTSRYARDARPSGWRLFRYDTTRLSIRLPSHIA